MESAEDLVLSKCGRSYHYNRSSSSSSKKLETILSEKYNVDSCVVVPSGMAAINSVLQSIILNGSDNPINIVYSSELYCDTQTLIKYIEKLVSSCIKVDVTKPNDIVALFRKQINDQVNILFFETCSNPNGYIFDFSIIEKLKQYSKTFYVIVDNTWLTDKIFNPFEHGATIVVTSLTKYYSGVDFSPS